MSYLFSKIESSEGQHIGAVSSTVTERRSLIALILFVSALWWTGDLQDGGFSALDKWLG